MYFMLSPSFGDPEIVAVQGLCIDHSQLSIHLVMNFKSISVNAALNQQYNKTEMHNKVMVKITSCILFLQLGVL